MGNTYNTSGSNESIISEDDIQLSLRVINTQYKFFSDMVMFASALKDTIIMCMSPNIYAHPTLLKNVDSDMENFMFLNIFLHDNSSFNIMMCVSETIDRRLALEVKPPTLTTEKKNESLISDAVLKYFEMGLESVVEESEFNKKLRYLLSRFKNKKLISSRKEMESRLRSYLRLLTTIIDGSKFLTNLGNDVTLSTEEAQQEVVEAVTNYRKKSLELASQSNAVS
jgi:hypothetical protein